MNYLRNYTINLEHDKQIRNIGRTETISGTTLSKLERLGFEGIDASLETSLFEYGLAWVEKKGEWHFIHSINLVEGHFDNTSVPSGTDWRREWCWAAEGKNLKSLLSSLGMTEEEFEELPFPQKAYEIFSHWGCLNTFGESHWGGFYIFKDGRNRVVEWLEWVNGLHGF